MASIKKQSKQPKVSIFAALLAGVAFGILLTGLQATHKRFSTEGPDGKLPGGAATAASSNTTALQQRIIALEEKIRKLQEDRKAAVDGVALERDAARKELEGAQRDKAQLRQQVSSFETQINQLLEKAQSSKAGAAAGTCQDRHTPWKPSPERNKQNPALAAFLEKVAINNEVLVAVSNINYARPGGMLSIWLDNVKRVGVKNAMVIALDDETKANVESEGLKAFRMDLEIPESQKNVGSNHAVSGLKFRILKEFMNLGYAVLLSDVDIVTLQNPFDFLHRDVDVESMSDGWDQYTAYGFNDVLDDESMGWARYAHSMRIFVFNSGLFYLRPTQASLDLLDRVIYRVETENGWDQALFNEVIFFPFSPRNDKDPSVTRRVMDINQFMNSKLLFKLLRHNVAQFSTIKPVMVHVNYHPDKWERMKAVVKRYVGGDMHALDAFPDGSG